MFVNARLPLFFVAGLGIAMLGLAGGPIALAIALAAKLLFGTFPNWILTFLLLGYVVLAVLISLSSWLKSLRERNESFRESWFIALATGFSVGLFYSIWSFR